jgi:hypothetical protein
LSYCHQNNVVHRSRRSRSVYDVYPAETYFYGRSPD